MDCLTEDALVLKTVVRYSRSLARPPASSPFLRRQEQPLYSSKYRNDLLSISAPERRAAVNAQELTTSNYVIAEELLTVASPSFSDIPGLFTTA